MALSGFIKQLLETDSVFSAEAKKFTGINDSANTFLIREEQSFGYPEIGTIFDISIREDEIFIFLPNFRNLDDIQLSRIDIIQPGTLVKFVLDNIDNAKQVVADGINDPIVLSSDEAITQQRITANSLNGFTLLVESVEYTVARGPANPPELRLSCSRTAADGPELVPYLRTFRDFYKLDPIFIIPPANNLTVGLSISALLNLETRDYTLVNNSPSGLNYVLGANAQETAENLGKAFQNTPGDYFTYAVKEILGNPGFFGVQIFGARAYAPGTGLPDDSTITIHDSRIGFSGYFIPGANPIPSFNPADDIISNFGPVDITFDTRIAAVINDVNIATQASNGATMFNLDNNSPRDKLSEGAGVALKYAAHYHSDKLIRVVTNNKDSAGNPLFRFEREPDDIIEDTARALYNPAAALAYVTNKGTDTDSRIRVTYTDSSGTRTVATYGTVGMPVTGNEFLTYDDLIARLKEAESTSNVTIEDATTENVFLLKTRNKESTVIYFIEPGDSSDIFTDPLGDELTRIEIGGLVSKTLKIDAEPVFDSVGSVVFSNETPDLLF